MGKCRLVLVTALAFLLEAWVLVWFPLWGVRPGDGQGLSLIHI